MTKQEITIFLNKIVALYQSFKPDAEMRDQWHGVFADVPAQAVDKALTKYARVNSKGFAPTPGELFILLPKAEIHQDETLTWAADGASYTIDRGGDRHTYQCAPPEEKWKERKRQYARGYGYCIEKRARGWASWYAPLAQCREVGFDSFGGERLPRFEQI